MKKQLLKMHVDFQYASVIPMRMRMTTHCADQITARSAEGETSSKIGKLQEFASLLGCVALSNVPIPQPKDAVIYFFEKTQEIIVTNFLLPTDDQNRKNSIDRVVIAETYLRRVIPDGTPFLRIRNSPHDTCIAILKDGSVVMGKDNQWFL